MTATTRLPSPQDRPTADIVIFDGNCQFCTRQVERLQRWDRHKKLAFVSLHDPQVRQIAPNLTHEQMMEQIFVVEPSGRQHGGAKAIRYLSLRLPRLWPVAPFLRIPFSLAAWQWLYNQVAQRRYQLNQDDCESGACKVHMKRARE